METAFLLNDPLQINSSSKSRRETLHGREYIVAPVTLVVPGVLNGSKGPLYYPPEEISRNPSDWNGVPLVVYHPTRNGLHISARDPEVARNQEVGRLYRVHVNSKRKLVGQAWFDVGALKDVANGLLTRIENSEKIEISTG